MVGNRLNSSFVAYLNRASVLLAFALTAIALAAIIYHWLYPVEVRIPPDRGPELVAQANDADRRWSVTDFEGVWHKRLLTDPPPKPIVEPVVNKPVENRVVTPPPPVPLKLVSILYSSNAQVAVFRSIQPNNNESIRLSVGDSHQGVQVEKIERELVRIQFNGQAVDLKLAGQ
jgi:hypothetical protein